MGRSILVVEDEADLAELIRFNLNQEGYDCRCAGDGLRALAEAQRVPPDLIVLDRMLPGKSGDDVLTELRRDRRTSGVPVIMLTAKAEESDELVGFALGADDYICKPFSMKLLLARIAAVARRGHPSDLGTKVLQDGPVLLDADQHEVKVDDAPVQLTPMEFRILQTLMSARGRVLERAQLIDKILGTAVAVTDRTMDVHVSALRKKLGPAASWVQTIRGVGYAFRSPD